MSDSLARPLGTSEAFARLGLLLGLFPPAAIFARLLWLARGDKSFTAYLLLFVVMNVVCAAVGRLMGGHLGRLVGGLEQRSWALTFAVPALLGFVWGVVTGGAGGLIVFGFGALFGAACAVPVGALAFAAFTPLHRLLARGGMIEERQFWPLACGVTGVVTALILSPQLFA